MAKKKFIPTMGLDNLTEAEKREYYESACEYYDIPPELNLLEYMWMNKPDGTGKNLVLYAKRGATDMIRANRGISVDEIREILTPEAITFIAKGHDSTGRTDMAVGSATTAGLKGALLQNAIMIAQTRATRRLTLQFVGGGLLDESEVEHGHTSSVPSDALIAPAPPQPVVKPVDAPGTEVSTSVDKPESQPSVTEEPRKRRGRPKRTEAVSLDSPPAETPAEVTPAQLAAQEALTKLKPEPIESEKEVLIREMETKLAELKGAKEKKAEDDQNGVFLISTPKTEQLTQFKARLFNYTNNVLRKGGMVGSEGIGGIEYKVRAFVRLMFPKTLEVKQLSIAQWETLLGYLDEQKEKLGPEGLVKLINEKLGVKE